MDLVIFTEEILNGKLHFLCSAKDWKRLLCVKYMLMMNIQNLDSKRSLSAKFKDGICTKLCLKPRFVFKALK